MGKHHLIGSDRGLGTGDTALKQTLHTRSLGVVEHRL